MLIIDCDYLPNPAKAKFPPELALLIVRKAASLADAFEQHCISSPETQPQRWPPAPIRAKAPGRCVCNSHRRWKTGCSTIGGASRFPPLE
jgi:hypothetical protein